MIMKKFLPLFALVVVSFFLFSSHILAAEYTTDLTQYMPLLESSEYQTLKSFADTYVEEHPGFYYIISYDNQSGRGWNAAFCNTKVEFQSNALVCIGTSGNTFFYVLVDGVPTLRPWNSGNIILNIVQSTVYYNYYLYTNYPNVSIRWTSSFGDNIYNIVYNDYTFSFSRNMNTSPIPSLYDIWLSQQPPPPVDNTPLLTDFYTLVLDKIVLICDFFTSSYVYLSIFVIFILYFVILLFRRLR